MADSAEAVFPSPHKDVDPPEPTYTATQVADAIAAALEAKDLGNDPKEAALAAITALTETPS